MRPLDGKVVLITGASRGLGVDMAHAFAAQKAKIALAARSADELAKVRADVEAAGVEAVSVPADLGDLPALPALVARVEQSLGPIDVLVNNAGLEHVLHFETESLEKIDQIIRVNLTGLMSLTRIVLPGMIERSAGHIVNVASVAGLVPVPYNTVYSATKHAVIGFSRSLRLELKDQGVGVSVVSPGFVDGGMFLEWGRPAPKMAGSVTPKQVADAVVDAVLRNRGEVVVTKGLARLGGVMQAIAPGLSGTTMERTGMIGYLRDQADINKARE
jgi:short-subunit dehydrogenase